MSVFADLRKLGGIFLCERGAVVTALTAKALTALVTAVALAIKLPLSLFKCMLLLSTAYDSFHCALMQSG